MFLSAFRVPVVVTFCKRIYEDNLLKDIEWLARRFRGQRMVDNMEILHNHYRAYGTNKYNIKNTRAYILRAIKS